MKNTTDKTYKDLASLLNNIVDDLKTVIVSLMHEKKEVKKSKPMTPEQIREALKLKPFNEFKFDVLCAFGDRIKKLLSLGYNKNTLLQEMDRQTGRTTKILCYALSEMSYNNKVLVASETFAMTHHMRDKLITYANQLNLDISLISDIIASRSKEGLERLKGIDRDNIKEFWDHLMVLPTPLYLT